MKKQLCLALLVACATTATAYAQSRSNYIPRTERGQLVANIVQRWSGEAAKKIGTTPKGWANAMASAFGKVSIEQLREAGRAGTLEDMVAMLQPEKLISLEAGRASVYRHLAPCHAFSVDLSADQTVMLNATDAILCNVPATATGLVLKITAQINKGVGGGDGFMFVWPAGETVPWSERMPYSQEGHSDHVTLLGGTAFNISNLGEVGVTADVNIMGYFEAAPVAKQNCTVTAQAAGEVPDTGNKFTLAPPACPSGTQLMSVSCEAGDRAARLRGNTPTTCSFDDVTPLDGKKGWGFAQARCCSVSN